MDWGIYLTTSQLPGMSAEETIENSVVYAQTAEKLGFSHAWVLEHHFTRYGVVGSALLHAGFVLGRTKTLKVGTAIQVLPLHHPVMMAEQVALLDQLSKGRLMFGIGRGTFRKDFEVFGADMSKSREMMAESLAIMRKCWLEGRAQADSAFYKFPEVEVYPEVYSKPHPELYTVAVTPESIAWAGREGIPLIFGYSQTDEEMANLLEQYDAEAEAAGHDPTNIPHVISCIAGASRNGDDIRRACWDNLVWWVDEGYAATKLFVAGASVVPSYEWRQREYEQQVLRGMRNAADTMPDRMAKNPIGSPQECIDKLNATVEITGIRRFAFGFDAAGARGAVLDSLQLYVDEVLPFVGDGFAAAPQRELVL